MGAAKKIKMLLVEKEITITELAQKLGTTQPNISGKMNYKKLQMYVTLMLKLILY